jgi:hypothetical protein
MVRRAHHDTLFVTLSLSKGAWFGWLTMTFLVTLSLSKGGTVPNSSVFLDTGTRDLQVMRRYDITTLSPAGGGAGIFLTFNRA